MRTPICDFVRRYAASDTLRLHMPGHKGVGEISEMLDITEIKGADSLYDADGIIRESEENASRLFGCRTYYSTEGSSLCIRAMLYLTDLYAKEQGKSTKVLAARNVHKSFLSAAALIDLDVEWLFPSESESYLSCNISAEMLEAKLSMMNEPPVALYVTSPDYLGNIEDISSLAKVCHKYGVLLIVDNAHGAYLKFLPKSRHPIDLGADICCDSAHKTLPVLTGGAYLHLSSSLPESFIDNTKTALSLFSSTSPSYLILQSLDKANAILDDGFVGKLSELLPKLSRMRCRLGEAGYKFVGDEDMKLTLDAKAYGYRGVEIAEYLRRCHIECEFADDDFLVLMPTPMTEDQELVSLEESLLKLKKKAPIYSRAPRLVPPKRICSVREAMMSPRETLPVELCEGRILADASVSCPPAVPIVVCGELIDSSAIECFRYYGVDNCRVLK